MPSKGCRFCSAPLVESLCDLGMQPLANAFLSEQQLDEMERFYPLHAFVCGSCFLVQVEEFESPEEIFSQYAYFSSFSTTWLERAEQYARSMAERLGLGKDSRVLEIGSNDGYLLQHFRAQGIPVLGIDPAANCAQEARNRGVPTLVEFFGTRIAASLSAEGKQADLLVANNVLAHVPALNDFVAGIALILARRGTASIEVPHLLRLIEQTEYDTIYHEHFSYFSLQTALRVFASHGLSVVDVEELPTHGGSMRMLVQHSGGAPSPRVRQMLAAEEKAGLASVQTYREFGAAVVRSKLSLWEFLTSCKHARKSVAAYGAAAKGNTLLNYCGVRKELVSYVVDRNPYKQNRYLPGSHIPVYPVEHVMRTRPDYLLILPWNLADEIAGEMAAIREWGGRFVTAIPEVKVF